MFSPSPVAGVFRQGEIVSDLVQVLLRAESLGHEGGDVELEEKTHPYALIMTQDCDLDWDFKARAQVPEDQPAQENKRQAKLVPNILLCELTTAEILRPRLAGGDVLKRIRSHQDERYYCLQAVPAAYDRIGQGMPELVADFKRVFSIPTEELYKRLGLGMQRRTILETPYLQHLGSRFGYYCLRVALPEPAAVQLQAAQTQTPPALPPPSDGV